MLTLVLVGGCSEFDDYARISGSTMGTYYALTCRCPKVSAEQIDVAVTAELERVNAQMSTYLPDSELSRFNNAALNDWLPVSADLIGVIDAALRISALSGGAFDVTAGPLINLWGFGPDGAPATTPTEVAILEARRRTGSAFLQLDESRSALKKTRSVYVDLSAIAKGHGVDRLAALLVRQGCTDYLVEIGGEVIGHGVNPTGSSWRIGIEVPDPQRVAAIQRVLSLLDRAIATSGDYRNFLDLGGKRISHTIDARTGYPVSHDLASVSVIHESAMWADGLATALNVLGPEAGFELATEEDLAAFFVIRQAAGFEERYTPAMQAYLDSRP
jgi:thiamine biosynthesis lipoprotein